MLKIKSKFSNGNESEIVGAKDITISNGKGAVRIVEDCNGELILERVKGDYPLKVGNSTDYNAALYLYKDCDVSICGGC